MNIGFVILYWPVNLAGILRIAWSTYRLLSNLCLYRNEFNDWLLVDCPYDILLEMHIGSNFFLINVGMFLMSKIYSIHTQLSAYVFILLAESPRSLWFKIKKNRKKNHFFVLITALIKVDLEPKLCSSIIPYCYEWNRFLTEKKCSRAGFDFVHRGLFSFANCCDLMSVTGCWRGGIIDQHSHH